MKRYSNVIAVIAATAAVYTILFSILNAWSNSYNHTSNTPLFIRQLAVGATLLILALCCQKIGHKQK